MTGGDKNYYKRSVNCPEKLEPTPNNPNPDMMVLKDAYLGKTGQILMEINMVIKPEQNAPVFYHATHPTSNRTVTLATECEDTLNHLGNC